MELLNRRPGSPTSKQPLKIFIVSANNATFELSIFGGTSDMALHRAVATRMGVPPAYSDGSIAGTKSRSEISCHEIS